MCKFGSFVLLLCPFGGARTPPEKVSLRFLNRQRPPVLPAICKRIRRQSLRLSKTAHNWDLFSAPALVWCWRRSEKTDEPIRSAQLWNLSWRCPRSSWPMTECEGPGQIAFSAHFVFQPSESLRVLRRSSLGSSGDTLLP